MKTLMATLLSILAILNWLVAPVSVLWLMLLGEWWAVGLVFLSLFSHFLLAIALLPAMAFAVPAAALSRRRPAAAMILGLPGLLYTAALITVWCMGALTYLLSRATPTSWIPLMLLAFSIGTAPWTYMAQKEAQGGAGEGSIMAAFFAQLAFVAVIIAIVFFRPASLRPLWLLFSTIMLIHVFVAAIIGVVIMREEAASNRLHAGADEDGL
jgi:hypothetical protein